MTLLKHRYLYSKKLKLMHQLIILSSLHLISYILATTYNVITIAEGETYIGSSSIANFSHPKGIAIDSTGTIYVSDTGNNQIKKLSPDNTNNYECAVLAGSGYPGHVNGQGLQSVFNYPLGITIGNRGVIFVADYNNEMIRSITVDGIVTDFTTVADEQSFGLPSNLVVDQEGNMYIISHSYHALYKIQATNSQANLIVGNKDSGWADGIKDVARFNQLTGIAYDGNGYIFVSDSGNNMLRMIDLETNQVKTLSRSGRFEILTQKSDAIVIHNPKGLVIDKSGNLIIVENGRNRILLLSPDGQLKILAGANTVGSADGEGQKATFNGPYGLAIDTKGDLYVTEEGGNRIKKIVVCSSDSIFDSQNGNCTSCPLGMFPTQDGKSCIPCPREAILEKTGLCRLCEVGKQPNIERNDCIDCLSGTFKSEMYSETCLSCPSNSICSKSGFLCKPGFTLNQAKDDCLLCKLGHVKSSIGNGECTPCTEGFAPDESRVQCISCKSGSYRPFMNYTSCIPCPRNAECSNKQFTCISGFIATQDSCVPVDDLARPPEKSFSSSTESKDSLPIISISISITIVVLLLLGSACFVRKMFRIRRILKSKTVLLSDNNSQSNTHSSLTITAGTKTTSLSYDSNSSRIQKSHDTSTSNRTVSTIEVKAGLCIPAFLLMVLKRDFTLEDKIAKGGGGVLFLGRSCNTDLSPINSRIVIKDCSHILESNSLNRLDIFYQELSIMYMLRNSKNIVKFLGFSEHPLAIIMKYYPDGDLGRFLGSPALKKTKRLQVGFIRDLLEGLIVLMNNGIAHCDLKPQNVLLERPSVIENGRELICVLTDFGISSLVNDTSLTVAGFRYVPVKGASIAYASPESLEQLKMIRNKKYSLISQILVNPLQSDIYSLGIVIYEITCRILPIHY